MKKPQLAVGLLFLTLSIIWQYNQLIRIIIQLIFHAFVLKEQLIPSMGYPNWSPQARAFNHLTTASQGQTPTLQDLRASFEAAKYFQSDASDVVISTEYAYEGENKVPFLRLSSASYNPKFSLSILYFHAGGMSIGSAWAETSSASFLANKLTAQVVSVDYRLLPEHTISDAVNDAVTVYKHLLKEGINSSRIIFYGCSSGGLMSLLTAQAVKKSALPMPKAVAPLSISYGYQLLDKYDLQEEQKQQQSIPSYLLGILDLNLLTFFNSIIESNDNNLVILKDLLSSVAGLPPVFMLVSEFDLLLYGNSVIANELRMNGVPVTFNIFPQMFHCHAHLFDLIPEGQLAMQRIINWMATEVN